RMEAPVSFEPSPTTVEIRRQRLFRPSDWLIAASLMAIGGALRCAYFSGFGLGDDPIFRGIITHLLTNHNVPPDNISYRFPWWFPTALLGRILGPGEMAMILPIFTFAMLGLLLVYAFGLMFWGRPGGVIAALLLIFLPLDFAWSTMMANDIVASFFFGM